MTQPMATDPNELLQHASRLTPQQRAALAAALLDSLDETVDDDAAEAWDEDLARRVADVEQGKVEPIPWPQPVA